jgi:uncharacterized protein (TIGR03437 family)
MIRFFLLFLAITILANAGEPLAFQTRYIRLGAQDTSGFIMADAAGNYFILSSLASNSGSTTRVTKTDGQGNVVASFDLNMVYRSGSVDPDGNVFIVGARGGPHSSAAVTKLDNALTHVLASTTLGVGAKGSSGAQSVAFDSARNAYVTGSTCDPDFPATPGAYQTAGPMTSCAPGFTPVYTFVTKLPPDLSTIFYSTFFGNPSLNCVDELCIDRYATTAPVGIAVDAAGEVTIGGNSNSPFVADPSANIVTRELFPFGFLAKFSADGSSLIAFSTIGAYAPHGPAEAMTTMVVDSNGDVVVVGPFGWTFMFGPDAIQPAISGLASSFVAKYDAKLQNLVWGTYFGDAGAGSPTGLAGVALDEMDNIWVTGISKISTLPREAPETGVSSVYVAEISADGSSLLNLSLTQNLGGRAIACGTGGVAVLGLSDLFLLSAPPGQDTLFTVASAANSVSSGTIAPAELISLFGNGIGPVLEIPGQVVDGAYTNTLGGYQVLFNGVPAPLLYAGRNQINVVAPQAISTQPTTTISITGPEGAVAFPTVFVAAQRPQIFKQPSNGMAIAFNQDGTFNSATNPAQAGSVVTLLITGLGLVDEQHADGSIQTVLEAYQAPPVTAFANQLTPAAVVSVGDLPGAVFGVVQVSVQLPQHFLGGSLALQAGGSTSNSAKIYYTGP